jgi:hypothetical protein
MDGARGGQLPFAEDMARYVCEVEPVDNGMKEEYTDL